MYEVQFIRNPTQWLPFIRTKSNFQKLVKYLTCPKQLIYLRFHYFGALSRKLTPKFRCQKNIFSQINSLKLQTWERSSRMGEKITRVIKHRDIDISWNAWVAILVLPFSSYLIFVTQLPHLQNGIKILTPYCCCTA